MSYQIKALMPKTFLTSKWDVVDHGQDDWTATRRKNTIRISTLAPDTLPDISKCIQVSASKSELSMLVDFCSDDSPKFYCNVINFTPHRLVASNEGVALCALNKTYKNNAGHEEFSCLVPRIFINAMLKCIKRQSDVVNFYIDPDAGRVWVLTPTGIYGTCDLVGGTYPPFEQAFPHDPRPITELRWTQSTDIALKNAGNHKNISLSEVGMSDSDIVVNGTLLKKILKYSTTTVSRNDDKPILQLRGKRHDADFLLVEVKKHEAY